MKNWLLLIIYFPIAPKMKLKRENNEFSTILIDYYLIYFIPFQVPNLKAPVLPSGGNFQAPFREIPKTFPGIPLPLELAEQSIQFSQDGSFIQALPENPVKPGSGMIPSKI
jgi:hypothetical protein